MKLCKRSNAGKPENIGPVPLGSDLDGRPHDDATRPNPVCGALWVGVRVRHLAGREPPVDAGLADVVSPNEGARSS